MWQAELAENPTSITVSFTYQSPDGENGFPGNLLAVVSHTLTNQDEWIIDYEA